MKRVGIIGLVLLTVLSAFGSDACAQHHKRHTQRQFDFQMRAGANFSQIDGDGSGNYNKPGFHGAVATSFPISDDKTWRFTVELGLTSKGSVINNSEIYRTISLLYVEVPLLVSYNTDDGKFRLGAGIAPAILAKSKVMTNHVYSQLDSENYRRLDALPICVSLGYRFSKVIGVDMRYYNSMLTAAKESGTGTYRIFRSNKGQFNRLLQFGITFNF